MALTQLVEKGADVDLLREMPQFVAQRMMGLARSWSDSRISGVPKPPKRRFHV